MELLTRKQYVLGLINSMYVNEVELLLSDTMVDTKELHKFTAQHGIDRFYINDKASPRVYNKVLALVYKFVQDERD